jgi:hypothetical protein
VNSSGKDAGFHFSPNLGIDNVTALRSLLTMSVQDPNFWRPLHALRFDDLDDLRVSAAAESRRLDFKAWAFLQNPEKLREHLCAMANGNDGGGRFVFGAERDAADTAIARFVGQESRALRQDVSRLRSAAFGVDPPVHVDIQYVAIPSGGSVVVAEVRPSSDGPHQVKGCYHIRVTEGNGRMNHLMVMAAAQRHRGLAGRIGLPSEVFTKDHFQDTRAVLAGVALVPPYSGVPLLNAWDVAGRARLGEVLESLELRPEFATPDGIPFRRVPNGIGLVRFDALAWNVERFVEAGGRGARQRLPILELRQMLERALKQLATVLADLDQSLEFFVHARLWTLPQSDGLIELVPEDPDDPVDHYEGFRQNQMPSEGLVLGEVITAGDLSTREELRQRLARRFCDQLPLYCHTVRRVTPSPPA